MNDNDESIHNRIFIGITRLSGLSIGYPWTNVVPAINAGGADLGGPLSLRSPQVVLWIDSINHRTSGGRGQGRGEDPHIGPSLFVQE